MTRTLGTGGTLLLAAAMLLALLPAVPTAADDADAGLDAVVRGSVEQVYLYGADPGTPATLYDPDGEPLVNDELAWAIEDTTFAPGGDTTDDNGSLVFRGTLDAEQLEFSGIPAGEGYSVEFVKDGEEVTVEDITVLAPEEHPEQSFYDGQDLTEGLNYIETRDGTLLSVYVTLPGPAEEGPYPTLVEYSGYDVSQPPAPLDMGDLDLELSLGAPTMAIGQLLDYATVAVNIRGTGCSGGAFDYFETLQALDGYDAIESIAAQDWSANVGTTGVSYPGIAQLFLASTQPPSLAAAAPAAVISDHGRDTVMPGGIYNTGFAREWAEERELDTRYPDGQAWVDELIADQEHPAWEQCHENVQLRDQNLPLLDRIEANEHASDLWDTRAPWSFAQDITTNLFIIHSWQDEQTGGRSSALLDALDLDRDDRTVRFVGTNGTHVETLGPEVLTDLIEFLELYVAEREPVFSEREAFLGGQLPATLFEPIIAPMLYSDILGEPIPADAITIPQDRFTGLGFQEARTAYESEPPARILFETGAGEGPDGFPFPAFDHRFAWDELPDIAARDGHFDTDAATWLLQGDGTLAGTETEEPDPEQACAGAPASGFGDATGPHGGAIDCLVWHGLAEGLSDGRFGTQESVRRDQTATFLHRLLEQVDDVLVPDGVSGTFPDVGDGPHLTAVESLAATEPAIVAGYDDGTFRPRQQVTRGQIASMVVRSLDELARQREDVTPLPAADADHFDDVAGSPHEHAIARLAAAGVVEGYGDGSFGTQDRATRGQMATMLAGLLEELADRGVLLRPALAAAADTPYSSYVYDADAFADYSFEQRPSNDHIWLLQPAYTWLQPPEANSLSFVTDPFDEDQVMVGSASVDLWLDSDGTDTDLEVVVSEVRPDGTEMYVTTGWQRASKRALEEETSTALRPRPTFREQDQEPLTPGEFDQVRVETFPFGHAFRAGSQLRLTIEAPGGNRPIWRFDDVVAGGFENRVAHDDEHDSRVVLPIVGAAGASGPDELPPLAPCTPSDADGGTTAVRGQPCRTAPQ